jgi:hypothetical protein
MANGNADASGLSIPFADSFDLTAVLEKAEREFDRPYTDRVWDCRSVLAYKLMKYGIASTEQNWKGETLRREPATAVTLLPPPRAILAATSPAEYWISKV